MPVAQFVIESSMAHRFRLEAYDALDEDGLRVRGRIPLRAASSPRWGVPEPMFLTAAGPPGESRSVLQWREPASGPTFSMIPERTFRPGFDDSQLARVAELIRLDSVVEDEGTDTDSESNVGFGPAS